MTADPIVEVHVGTQKMPSIFSWGAHFLIRNKKKVVFARICSIQKFYKTHEYQLILYHERIASVGLQIFGATSGTGKYMGGGEMDHKSQISYKELLFIGPESDHWLCASLADSLTD